MSDHPADPAPPPAPHKAAAKSVTSVSAVEQTFERTLFASRWLMAPMYLGLVVALAAITFVFLRELVGSVPMLIWGEADDGVLVLLSLIDLTLAANLLLIVLFSGYENFVSKLDIAEHSDRPDWMGKVDYSALKMKLVGSIIAISAIHLLKRFMEVGQGGGEAINEVQLYWLTVIHLTFVVSGLLLAVMDWLGARSGGKHS